MHDPESTVLHNVLHVLNYCSTRHSVLFKSGMIFLHDTSDGCNSLTLKSGPTDLLRNIGMIISTFYMMYQCGLGIIIAMVKSN